MNHRDLSSLGAGFSNEALGSQAVFRTALQALSHPGRVLEIAHDAQAPSQGHTASAALLLSMLDADSTLWLSPALAASDAALWLHFHTGCQIVSDVSLAQFAWIGQGDVMPALASLAQGSDAYPDQSATCVIDLDSLSNAAQRQGTWLLSGPGIQSEQTLSVNGLAVDFLVQWAANHAGFPRGVDVFLAAQDQIVGLPRTTSIKLQGGH